MLIIGIDPGISGSICFFDDGKILDVVEIPTMIEGKKNKKQVNGSQIYNEISKRIKQIDKSDIKVIIEQVSAMPGQGVTSMFNFGQSFGILKGICSAMQLPMYFVRPAKWKKYFNLLNSEKEMNSISSNDQIIKKIKDLKDLYDAGVLNKEEFEKAKKRLLN